MPVNLYTPKSIVIPDHLPFKREMRDSTDFLTGGALQDTSQYDFKTLFYDVFFGADDSKIYAVGPPLMNLMKDLSFKFIYNNQILLYQCQDFIQCSIVTIEHTFTENEVELIFDCDHFSEIIRVKKEAKKFSNFAVVACQRNNKVKWIKTWCEWYTKFYKGDIYLYDNQSDNLPEVIEAIKDYNPTLIQWNFKFGPYNTFYNLFCQVGAYNHFRLKYRFDYGLVFDIDEYLVANVPLDDYLQKHNGISLFILDNYYIPNVRDKKVDFGIEDFHYRPKELRNRAFKYIFKREDTLYLDIHHAALRKGNRETVPGDLLYFNHYKGLSTYWKPWDQRDKIENRAGDLVEDIEGRKYIDKLSSIQ